MRLKLFEKYDLWQLPFSLRSFRMAGFIGHGNKVSSAPEANEADEPMLNQHLSAVGMAK
jgi:hypothetical protein